MHLCFAIQFLCSLLFILWKCKSISYWWIWKLQINLYKQNQNNPKVGFGRFCQFHPKNCVFPRAPGSHNFCVCKIHENFKLLLDSVNIESIVSITIETAWEKWFVTKIRTHAHLQRLPEYRKNHRTADGMYGEPLHRKNWD
jgi:hypothetical protein